MTTSRQAEIHQRHVEAFETFTRAVNTGDADLLAQVCAPEFSVFEPDIFDAPIRGLEAWQAEIAQGSQVEATFDVVRTQSVADALIVELNYTAPAGGGPEPWTLVYCFDGGKIVRQDAQRLG